jgi:hypothetical protein
MLFYQNKFNKDKIYDTVNSFFEQLPKKTIYIGSNMTNLRSSFFDSNARVTQVYVKE